MFRESSGRAVKLRWTWSVVSLCSAAVMEWIGVLMMELQYEYERSTEFSYATPLAAAITA